MKVLAQCQQWLKQLKELSTKRKTMLHNYESLRSHLAELKFELAKLDKESAEESRCGSSKEPSSSISSNQTEEVTVESNVSIADALIQESGTFETAASEYTTSKTVNMMSENSTMMSQDTTSQNMTQMLTIETLDEPDSMNVDDVEDECNDYV